MKTKREHVKVWVRTKPTTEFASNLLNVPSDLKTVNLHVPRDPKHGLINNQVCDWSFKVDGVLHGASQDAVFSNTSLPFVNDALDGYNSTILVFGQCGSGKSYSLVGDLNRFETRGILPRSLTHLFKEVERRIDTSYSISVSYYEIYNNEIYDLLGTRNADTLSSLGSDGKPESSGAMRSDPWHRRGEYRPPLTPAEDENGNVYIRGLSRYRVADEDHALSLMFEGETNRAVVGASYGLSSRSHAIFTVYLDARSTVYSNARVSHSQLTFVDLAGFERLIRSRPEGMRETEGKLSNESLTFLEQAVLALSRQTRPPAGAEASRDEGYGASHKVDGPLSEVGGAGAPGHVPYRQTALTHCLKPALHVRNKTLLVVTVWPELANIEQMVSSLRFGSIMRQLYGTPLKNEGYDPEIRIRELKSEITALRRELAMHDTLTNRHQITYEPLSEQQKYEIKRQVKQYLNSEIDQIDIVNVRQLEGVFESFKTLYGALDKEAEERARQKLTERPTSGAVGGEEGALDTGVALAPEAPKPGVGVPEGTGFGVGTTRADSTAAGGVLGVKRKETLAKQTEKEKEKEKEKEREREKSKLKHPGSPRSGAASGLGTTARQTPTTQPSDARGGADSFLDSDAPKEPPKKNEAFEEFKREIGAETHKVFLSNKENEQQKRQAYMELSRQLNGLKDDIDTTRRLVEQLRAQRESTVEVIDSGVNGAPVISEEEFNELKRLQQLKEQYRATQEDMETAKRGLRYCERQVQLARQKLVEEFEKWYYRTYVDAATKEVAGSKIPAFYVPPPMEDEHEKQARMQRAALLEQFGPESVAFQFAKSRVDKMKFYQQAMSQPQPQWRRLAGGEGAVLFPDLHAPRSKGMMQHLDHLLKY